MAKSRVGALEGAAALPSRACVPLAGLGCVCGELRESACTWVPLGAWVANSGVPSPEPHDFWAYHRLICNVCFAFVVDDVVFFRLTASTPTCRGRLAFGSQLIVLLFPYPTYIRCSMYSSSLCLPDPQEMEAASSPAALLALVGRSRDALSPWRPFGLLQALPHCSPPIYRVSFYPAE